jgi:AAA domain
VVVGIPLVVVGPLVPGRVVVVATEAVGTGRVVEESTSSGPDPPQPARAQVAASTASAAVPLERRLGKPNLAPLRRLSAGAAIVAAMMKLEATERDVPGDPAVLRLPRAALLVVAGVPGAGKTTLLARVLAPGSLVLDPEPIRARFSRRLGRLPYRLWRPLVHAEHFLRVLLALPGRTGLIVHDTGTRGWRRRLLVTLARRCGRTGHLLLLDVTAEAALEGQRRRRRTLPRSAFATHWRNYRRLRATLTTPTAPGGEEARGDPASLQAPGDAPGLQPLGDPDADPTGLHAEGWASVRLLDRPAANALHRIDIPHR